MDNQNVYDGFADEIAKLSTIERDAYANFMLAYETTLEAPPRQVEYAAFKKYYDTAIESPPDLISYQIDIDWEYYAGILSAGSGMLLAAFRTWEAFVLAAAGMPLRYLEGLMAVIAIEGNLVLYALKKARKEGSRLEETTGSRWGLIITVVLSVVAGLFQSSNLLVGSDGNWFITFMRWILVIFMGFGATGIAYLGGDTVGYQIHRKEGNDRDARSKYGRDFDAYKSRLFEKWSFVQAEFDDSLSGYRTRLEEAWLNSREYQAINSRKRSGYRNVDGKIDVRKFPKVSESFPDQPVLPENMSESAGNLPKDWRSLRPTLSVEGLQYYASLTPMEVKGVALRHRVDVKTVTNWRARALAELEALKSTGGNGTHA